MKIFNLDLWIFDFIYFLWVFLVLIDKKPFCYWKQSTSQKPPYQTNPNFDCRIREGKIHTKLVRYSIYSLSSNQPCQVSINLSRFMNLNIISLWCFSHCYEYSIFHLKEIIVSKQIVIENSFIALVNNNQDMPYGML